MTLRARTPFFAITCLAVLVFAPAASPVAAQSASEIVERMLDAYEERSVGIDDYTVVQDVMGVETLSYFEKVMVDGRPVFQLRSTGLGGGQMMGGQPSGEGGFDEIYAMGGRLAERARYAGVQRVDDYELHVLEIDDFEGLGIAENMAPDSDFTARSGAFYLDVDTYAPRRFEFEGEMRNDEGVHSVTSTVSLGDYREVEGLLMPFRTVVEVEGLGAAIDDDMRAEFEKMQEELEAMPPEQRAMVERMMSGQLEQFQTMLEGSGPMTVQILVREIRVNTGPPGA